MTVTYCRQALEFWMEWTRKRDADVDAVCCQFLENYFESVNCSSACVAFRAAVFSVFSTSKFGLFRDCALLSLFRLLPRFFADQKGLKRESESLEVAFRLFFGLLILAFLEYLNLFLFLLLILMKLLWICLMMS